jgi:hypothetical protein
MNEAWHRKNPLPKNATRVQRMDWHGQHATACGCREIPPSIRAAVRRKQNA